MKRTILTTLLALSAVISQAKSPDVNGIVVGTDGKPIPYVNVVLLASDSTFVQGATSGDDGSFNIITDVSNGILKVTSVGYETAFVNISDYKGIVTLKEDAKTLSEVVVKGQRPKTKLTGNSMVTSIQGSVLEKSGTAKEMLAKVPGMTQKGDDLEVLGKGTPIYYINGRKMNDKDELKRLRSEEIKEVEVITNPGAQYDATVSAVVRIKTVRREGTGFGFDVDVNNNSDLVYGFQDPSANLNLRYRHNNVDVFGGVNYWKWDEVSDSDPEQQSFIRRNDGNIMNILQTVRLRHDSNIQGVNSNLGFNWQLADNHSIGMRVERHDIIKSENPAWIDTDMRQWITGKEHEQTYAKSHSDQLDHHKEPYSWEGNTYYNGRVGKLGIDLNIDFITNKTSDENNINETTNEVLMQMRSTQGNRSRMLADKLVLSYPLWKGQLQAGTEMTFVTRNSEYQISNTSLPSAHSEVKEQNLAGFVEYACVIPKAGNFSAGLRYEHVGFDYDDLLNADNSLKRYTDDLFPSFSWANQWGCWQLSLNYSYKTQRPNFQMLDESIIYINSYSLQQGNPTLKNEKTQQLGLNAHWKWLNLYASYQHTEDAITQWSYIYNADEQSNEGMILIKTINLEKPVSIASAYLSVNPTFGCYSPNWTVGIQKYQMTNTLADPRESTGQRDVEYHRPMFIMNLNNAFRFKHSWQLEANLNSFTRGDFMNMRLTNDTWNLSFVIQKCWLKNDALCLRASLYDALQRTKQNVEMDCGYYILHQSSINNRHRLNISLRYTFNAQKSKYKGTGAGKDAAGRMKN